MDCNNKATIIRGNNNPIHDRIVENSHGSSTSPTTVDNAIPGVTCDSSVIVGDIVYMDVGGTAFRAISSSVSTSAIVGICIAKASATSCTVQVTGYTPSIYGGLVPGQTYFLSNTVLGQLTSTYPTTANHVIAPVGVAYNSTQLIINIGHRIIRS